MQALLVWQAFGNSDTFLPLSAQGSACHQGSSSLGARLWQKSQSPTTAPLSQDPADPERLLGRAKNTALNLFSPSLLCLSVHESNVRAQDVNL